jgi:hypothetical protein
MLYTEVRYIETEMVVGGLGIGTARKRDCNRE